MSSGAIKRYRCGVIVIISMCLVDAEKLRDDDALFLLTRPKRFHQSKRWPRFRSNLYHNRGT